MITISDYHKIVFFTGAGMSAESGIPTYRGTGGIWNEYKWEKYACQEAFLRDPSIVLNFHELRRTEALKCKPHTGHEIIKGIEEEKPSSTVITQNIDGMHQRANSVNVLELHGSLWRMRCETEKKVFDDFQSGTYKSRKCTCGGWLRPDIIWFNDMLDENTILKANSAISTCDLFISIGTSALVWPAAGYPRVAKDRGAFCIEINPEDTELSILYDLKIRTTASLGLEKLFNS